MFRIQHDIFQFGLSVILFFLLKNEKKPFFIYISCIKSVFGVLLVKEV